MEKKKAGFEDYSPYAFSPYNFVEMPEESFTITNEESQLVRRGLHGQYSPDRHHGTIQLSIETLTPVYTKAAVHEDGHHNSQYDFYHYGNPHSPVISGSSLRGMFRHLLETISHGYIDISDGFQHPFYHRSMASVHKYLNEKYFNSLKSSDHLFVKAGYIQMRNGKPWLYPAQTINSSGHSYNFVRVKQSDISNIKPVSHTWAKSIYFQVSGAIKKSNQRPVIDVPRAAKVSLVMAGEHEDWHEGRLVKTGAMQQKKHEYIFGLWVEEHAIEITDFVWNSFRQDIISRSSGVTYNPKDALINEWSEIIREEKNINNEKTPIFYVGDDKGVKYLGTAKMMRVPDQRTANDAIPKGIRKPEGIEYPLDVADSLFGYVSQKGLTNESIRGRVWFGDGIWTGMGDPFVDSDYLVPFTLNGPKPSAFQMYLKQKGKNLTTYSDLQAKIRGRKFYWHKSWVKSTDIFQRRLGNKALSGVDTAMRPIKAGQPFIAEISFYNLSDVELGALLWILELDPNKYAFRVGMGKPLGMGSIKITSKVVLDDRQKRYSHLFIESAWDAGHLSDKETSTIGQNCIASFKKAISPNGDFNLLGDIQDLLSILEFENKLDSEKIAYYKIGKEQATKSQFSDEITESKNYKWLDGYRSQWAGRTPLGSIRSILDTQTGVVQRGDHGDPKNHGSKSVSSFHDKKLAQHKSQDIPNQRLIKLGEVFEAVVIGTAGFAKYKVKIEELTMDSTGQWAGRVLEPGERVKAKVLEVVNGKIKNVRIEPKNRG